jgi:prolipoprotein diacylglyceryl transferase
VHDDVIGYIPSPPSNGIHLGPFELHFYGLLIAVAVLVAAWVAQRRWARLGGLPATIVPIAFWAVVAGLIGARLYSVATSWRQDTSGDWVQIFEIWNGGLGIWGGVGGGVLGGWLKAKRMHLPLSPLLDTVAPALALAQAIGRWGNYFNQELFGLPSKLPWAVRITNQAQLAGISPARYRPPLSAAGTYLPGTFQPTFLYECIWDLATFGLLLLIERKVKLRRGYLFAAYAALYTFGRFFTEYLRIDPAHRYLGLRLNDWTSIGVFAVAASILVAKGRPAHPRAGHFVDSGHSELVGDPLPTAVLAAERARLGLVVEEASAAVEAEASPVVVEEASPGDEGAPKAATDLVPDSSPSALGDEASPSLTGDEEAATGASETLDLEPPVVEEEPIELVEGAGGPEPPSDQAQTTQAAAEGPSLP